VFALQAFFNQILCSSGVNLLETHPTVLTYHTTGHFQRKNKNGSELTTKSDSSVNNSKSYA